MDDKHTVSNKMALSNLLGLDLGDTTTVFMDYVRACLFVYAGGLLWANMQAGPILAGCLIVYSILFTANPYSKDDKYEKS